MNEPLTPGDCIDGDGSHITGFTFAPDPVTEVVHSFVCESAGCTSYVTIQHVQLQEVGHVTCMKCLKMMTLIPGSLH